VNAILAAALTLAGGPPSGIVAYLAIPRETEVIPRILRIPLEPEDQAYWWDAAEMDGLVSGYDGYN
jgi:hypothetical protein